LRSSVDKNGFWLYRLTIVVLEDGLQWWSSGGQRQIAGKVDFRIMMLRCRRGDHEMKQIVNGVVYDTEMATKVVSHDNISGWTFRDLSSHSHTPVTETLYRTENGNWFQIRVRRVLIFKDEPKLLPMAEKEVYNWLHKFNEIELLRQHFRDRVSEG
jgi:hypothetical protein